MFVTGAGLLRECVHTEFVSKFFKTGLRRGDRMESCLPATTVHLRELRLYWVYNSFTPKI